MPGRERAASLTPRSRGKSNASDAAQAYAALRHSEVVVSRHSQGASRHSQGPLLNRGTSRPILKPVKSSSVESLKAKSPRSKKRATQVSIDTRCGKSGYLLKQGVGNRAWKERWFVFPGHGPLLLWYDQGSSVVPRRAVHVVAVSESAQLETGNFGGSSTGYSFGVWADPPEKGAPEGGATRFNSFIRRMSMSNVERQTGRTRYQLAAPTLQEAEAWLDVLREVVSPEEGGTQQSTRATFSAGQAVDEARRRLDSIGRWAQAEHHGHAPDPASAAAAAESMHALERAIASGRRTSGRRTSQGRATDGEEEEQDEEDEKGVHGALGAKGVQGAEGAQDAPVPPEGEGCAGSAAASSSGGDGAAADAQATADEGGAVDEPAADEPAAAGPLFAPPQTDEEKRLARRALFLCRQAELSADLAEELESIATEHPEALMWADARGILPVHWLCGSPAVSVELIAAVFDAIPTAATYRDSRGILPLHWLCANANASAEMLLLVLEAHEEAAEAVDHFGQLPLHWLCGSASEDVRAYQLIIDANPDACDVPDRHGLMPLHWLCNNAFVYDEALELLLEAQPEGARMPDGHGQLPIHILCNNEAVTAALLQQLLTAFPDSASMTDADGCLPLHFLAKTQPDAVELWQLLLRATEEAAGGGGGGGLDLSELRALMPVLLGEGNAWTQGDVTGIKGRVKDVVKGAATAYVRPEDRGALLFVSSMSAVKHTREGCKQAAALLDALMIKYEARDVFVDVAYANQLRRLANAGGGKAPLPQLPQLYVDGACVGGLEQLEQLNELGELRQKLESYTTNWRGVDADERECIDCGGRRFVICTECSGTRRGRRTVFGNQLKCSNCNENGLMPCATCNAADAKLRADARVGLEGEGGVIETVKDANDEQRRARADVCRPVAVAAAPTAAKAEGVVEAVKQASEAQLRAREHMRAGN